jgi:two-component system chemotaxis sensor kinase CheA
MSALNELSDSLASSALLADAHDLRALANLHEKLVAVAAASGKDTDAAPPTAAGVTEVAQAAMKTVEQIILHEVPDASAAMETVCQQIAQLQQILSGTAPIPGDFAEKPSHASDGPPASAERAGFADGEAAPKAEDLSLITDFVSEARSHLETAEADLLRLEEHPEETELVNSIFRAFHTIKGVAGFLNLLQVGALAHAAENLLDRARKGEVELVGRPLEVVLQSLDAMKLMVSAVEAAARDSTMIPAHAGLDRLLERLKDAASGQAPSKDSDCAAPAQGSSEPESSPSTTASPAASAAPKTEAAVRVATARLDTLINTVGELVIAQAMVSQDVMALVSGNQRTARNLSQLGKLTRELQDLTMTMRMVPIAGLFQKMSRLVRDLARKAGKEIELRIIGGDTELDRNLVESVADPLVHMVRNAADHGVENIEERRVAGKPPAGHIELKAYHQAGNIIIEISDDGRGLNKDRILKKALAAGLIKQGQELSEQEIFRLIFAPGLSTAEKVTDVSGRGVGMDVVRRNVEALRGRIDIASELGKGSTFTIRLPLTLAVIDGLVVKVGDQRYILPITSIEQSLRPKESQISTVQSRAQMCMVRDRLIPIFHLHSLFNVTPRFRNPWEGLLVLVSDGERRCAILVDELLGQEQVVIKSLGEAIESLPGISGGAILGDGTISLILDVPGLMDLVAKT